MTVVAIIQARMGSTRFPRKMMKSLLGRPVIAWTVQRTQLASYVDKVVVATSTRPEDAEIVEWCQANDVAVFQGSETDVLDRFYQCARLYKASYVARLTGDCPLIDPRLIDAVIALCRNDEVDYAANVEPMTYPEGMSVEVMPFAALELAWRQSTLPSHREHVTPFLRFHRERFLHSSLEAQPPLQHIRLTVDYEADLVALEALLGKLPHADSRPDFSLEVILEVIDQNPAIAAILSSKQRDLWRQEVMRDEGRVL